MSVFINQQVPSVGFEVYHHGKFKRLDLDRFTGQWLVLYFYPADFSKLCPTELKEAAAKYDQIRELNTELISISTDSVHAHKAWKEGAPELKEVSFPMAADPSGKLAKLFGVYMEEEGVAYRSTFIINPDGVLKALEIHDNSIGRSISEILRKLTALQYAARLNRQG